MTTTMEARGVDGDGAQDAVSMKNENGAGAENFRRIAVRARAGVENDDDGE